MEEEGEEAAEKRRGEEKKSFSEFRSAASVSAEKKNPLLAFSPRFSYISSSCRSSTNEEEGGRIPTDLHLPESLLHSAASRSHTSGIPFPSPPHNFH